jgi:hypothetical protein
MRTNHSFRDSLRLCDAHRPSQHHRGCEDEKRLFGLRELKGLSNISLLKPGKANAPVNCERLQHAVTPRAVNSPVNTG